MRTQAQQRRWRDYRTATDRRPVKEYIDTLDLADRAAIVAAMNEVERDGLVAARHLRDDIYEVRATGRDKIFRILFATEGERQQVLLAMEGFTKKTQATPLRFIKTAEDRLREWRWRGNVLRAKQGR